jgi:hypothetical protein
VDTVVGISVQTVTLEIRTVAGPVERCAVGVEWRPVHRLVACTAGPRGVAAAVAEARSVTHEHRARAEAVAVRAARRWVIQVPADVRIKSPTCDIPMILHVFRP